MSDAQSTRSADDIRDLSSFDVGEADAAAVRGGAVGGTDGSTIMKQVLDLGATEPTTSSLNFTKIQF